MTECVLVIAAHPDDEVLGCGGTIARHALLGADVDILIVADGVSSRVANRTMTEPRRDGSVLAAKILGANNPIFFDFPDQRLDTVSFLEITQSIERVLAKKPYSIIYTHHGADLNLDHNIVHRATATALRPMPSSRFTQLFAYEVASSTEWATGSSDEFFRPTHFVGISDFMESKMRALQAYDEEMRPFPHARSYEAIRAMATARGASVGLAAAEAFAPLRTIVR